MNTGVFCKAPRDLMACQGFISKVDGSMVELNSTAKLVLIYMIDRTQFFTGRGGKHFETQATIGNAVGVEWKAAARSLTLLVKHGVIIAAKERNLAVSPHLCWYYKGVDCSITLYGNELKKVVDMVSKPDNIAEQTEDMFEDEFLKSIGG